MTLHSILVVDDEPLIRMDIADMISDLGFHVIEARNADEAISLLEDLSDIIAVVTDVDMPGSMDGQLLAAAVHHRWPPCKLIIVSGAHLSSELKIPTGSVFLTKPIAPRKMARSIKSLGLHP